ncbi:MAG: glycoside hydrolase 15-related protein, partial [Deltaproteobacteria bacterium]|nr:glycoside hydrolase 15-related protein [Deltaproteobacteria bacterium]
MADLKAHFIDVEKGVVHYRRIRGAEEFERYKDLTKGLQSLDLHSLRGRDQKLAFWINIYNTAVIHGVIELGIENSVKEVSGFFDRVRYEIGGFHFSLNEMEHGILRGNRRHP